MKSQPLVLASSSKYRKKILQQITSDFICQSPEIDETRLQHENASELVERLAIEKAKAIARHHRNAIIIGSDQVCEFTPKNNRAQIIGKPKNHENAVRHLKEVSGQKVTLRTGLALYNAKTKTIQSCVDSFEIQFRELDDSLIENYLRADQPYDCAGAVKAESLGIILIEKMKGDDPNTLIGLPLIQLISMLNREQYTII